MKRFQTFLIATSPLLIILLVGLFLYLIFSPVPNIKKICKNLEIIDVNIDHNQALDVFEYSKKNNVKIPNTIINFDTHSDVYLYQAINKDDGAQIYNWLNEFFAKYPEAKDLYWVMPEDEAKYKPLQKVFKEKENNNEIILYGNVNKNPNLVNPEVDIEPYTQYLYVDLNSGYVKEMPQNKLEKLPTDPKNPNYKVFRVITCTQNTLPNFKNKEVILSIDGDYLSNSGYDTPLKFGHNQDYLECKNEIFKLLKTIKKKNIQPNIITLTISPPYIPEENLDTIYNFFEDFLKHSGKNDIIQEYSRKSNYKQVKSKFKKKYSSI